MHRLILIIVLTAVLAPREAGAGRAEYVILLHGLARTSRSMEKMGAYLKNQGFGVVNVDYASTESAIENLAEKVIPAAVRECRRKGAGRIHMVTHSMGGILARYYLEDRRIEDLGRVVMLSPPNQGSELVDRFGDWFFFKWIYGPAGRELGTDSGSLPARLGPADFELGVIAGDRSINPFLSLMIPGEDDGRVAVRRTKVEGMDDFMAVHSAHTFIMSDREAMEQAAWFLKFGEFRKRCRKGAEKEEAEP